MLWILQSGFDTEAAWRVLLTTLERFVLPYSMHEVVPKLGKSLPAPVLMHKAEGRKIVEIKTLNSSDLRRARSGWF